MFVYYNNFAWFYIPYKATINSINGAGFRSDDILWSLSLSKGPITINLSQTQRPYPKLIPYSNKAILCHDTKCKGAFDFFYCLDKRINKYISIILMRASKLSAVFYKFSYDEF